MKISLILLLRLESIYLLKIELCKEITKRLESLYVSNPLELWDRNKIYASLELIDPNKIIRVKPMRHNEIDTKEFKLQIKELLDLQAFLVVNPGERTEDFFWEKFFQSVGTDV